MSYGEAYFYRPQPEIVEELTGFDVVIGQSFDERAMSMLIDVLLKMRYALPQLEGPAELVRGDVVITTAQLTKWRDGRWGYGGTWRNGATFKLSEFVDSFHSDEKNFLHGPDGRRLFVTDEGRTFYLIRPKYAAKTFWTLLAGIHKRAYTIGTNQSYTWPNNAFIDNVGADDSKIEEVLKSTPAQEYAGGDQAHLYYEEWLEFFDIGRLIMGKDALLGANVIGDWFAKRNIDELVKRLDVVMLEALSPWLNMRSQFTPAVSVRILDRAQRVVDAGKYLICVLHLSSKDSAERIAYETARYLLIAGEKTSLRLAMDYSYSGGPIKPPVLDLGAPKGRFEVTNTTDDIPLLFRAFEKGQLFVNPYNYTYQVKMNPEPQPDPFVELKQQVAELQAALADTNAKARTQYEMHESLRLTVAELQQRLAQPISFSGTVKI